METYHRHVGNKDQKEKMLKISILYTFKEARTMMTYQ